MKSVWADIMFKWSWQSRLSQFVFVSEASHRLSIDDYWKLESNLVSAVNHNPSPFERISASSRSLRMSPRSQPSSSSTAGSELRSSDLLNSDPATQNSQIVLISRDPSLTLLEKITLLSVEIDTVEVCLCRLGPRVPHSAQNHLSVRRLPNSHVFGKSRTKLPLMP